MSWIPKKYPVDINATVLMAKHLDFPRCQLLKGLIVQIENDKMTGDIAVIILNSSMNTGNFITDKILPRQLIWPHWEYKEYITKVIDVTHK